MRLKTLTLFQNTKIYWFLNNIINPILINNNNIFFIKLNTLTHCYSFKIILSHLEAVQLDSIISFNISQLYIFTF